MFRKQALDQLNAPEDLERQVALVAPGTAIAATAVILLTVVALLWAVLGRVDVTVIARGVVIANNGFDLRVAAPIAGKIAARHVDVGDTVAPGDLLATFDTAEIDQDSAERKARATLLTTRLASLSDAALPAADTQNGAVSQDVEAFRAMLQSQRQDFIARLELERAQVQAELDRLVGDRAAATEVRAEQGGSVVLVTATQGDRVAKGDHMFTIAGGRGALSASAVLNRNEAGSVRPGMSAYVRPAGASRHGQSALKGRVVAISEHVVLRSALGTGHGGEIALGADPSSAVILARIAFDDAAQTAGGVSDAERANAWLRLEETLDIVIVVDRAAPIEIVLPNLATLGAR